MDSYFQVSHQSIISSFVKLLGYFAGVVFFDEALNPISLIGTGLIFFGVVSLVLSSTSRAHENDGKNNNKTALLPNKNRSPFVSFMIF